MVTPLQGLSYYDKTEATEELMARPKIESRPGVDVKTFTDSVYENAGGNYQVVWPGGGLELKVNNFKDVVVWNPQEAAGSKIGDMETGGWYVKFQLLGSSCAEFNSGRNISVSSLALSVDLLLLEAVRLGLANKSLRLQTGPS